MAAARVLGVDLGSSTSALARVDEAGRSAMIRSEQGDVLIPSIVFFEDEELLFGRAAKQQAGAQPGRAAEFVKRDMGQAAYSRAIGGELLPPEVVQACLLRKLCGNLKDAGGPKPGVVISVPACFNQIQRKAVLDAGRIAGLDLLGTINEPIAAALAFAESQGYFQPGEAQNTGCRVLVFDLGGGKLDVAIVEVKPQRVRIMAVRGDQRLGGRDWDARLAEHLASLFAKQFGEDPRHDMVSVRRLLERAEEAKQTLSTRQQARVRVERGENMADITITRQILEEITEDLVERARQVAAATIAQAGMSWRDVAHMLLIGGGSRMPIIAKVLEKLTGLPPLANVHPEEVVARGAALRAEQLLDQRAGRKPRNAVDLVELTSHNLGVEWTDPVTKKRESVTVISSGTELPCTATSTVSTTTEDQRTITVQLLEGHTRDADQCERVATVLIRDLPGELPKQAGVEVQYQCTTDMRLQVKAILEKNEQVLTIEVSRDRGLSETEVASWKKLVASKDGLKPILAHLATLPRKTIAGAASAEPEAAAHGEDGENHGMHTADLDEFLASRGAKKKAGSRKMAIMLAGHVLFATLGLAIGYYILMRIDPSYNWWHLNLPGLSSPAPAGGASFRDPR